VEEPHEPGAFLGRQAVDQGSVGSGDAATGCSMAAWPAAVSSILANELRARHGVLV
jgi:hypothetical protein